MKKILILIIAVLLSIPFSFAIDKERQMQFVPNSLEEKTGEIANLMGNFVVNWPKDRDDRAYTALLRVKIENMPIVEANKLSFKMAENCRIIRKESQLEKRNEILLYVEVVESVNYIEVTHPLYGLSDRYLINEKFTEKGVYEITLYNNATATIAVTTNPSGATLLIDGIEQYCTTPAVLPGIPLGKHTLSLKVGGQVVHSSTIDVTKQNISFSYDLRKRRVFTIDSSPSDAMIFIDQEPRGKSPIQVELPNGNYRIVAMLNSLERDTLNLTIDDSTPSKIELNPIKRKNFSVLTTYQGRPISTNLYLDNQLISPSSDGYSYRLSLPYDTYELRASYYGRAQSKTIRVRENSTSQYNLRIPTRNKILWPWQRDYEPVPWGVSAAYISKTWETKGEGLLYKSNFWGERNKSLGGFQVGLYTQPNIAWGFTAYTGLFYEYYYSQSDYMKEQEYYDQLNEHALYLPLHLGYQIPFSENVALTVHGGIGMNYSLYGEMTSTLDDSYSAPITDFYGEEGSPKRFNLAKELSLDLRLYSVRLFATTSIGLTDHKWISADEGDFVTTQNKYSIGVSSAVSTDDIEDWLDDVEDCESVYAMSFSYVNKEVVTRDNGNFQYLSHPFFATENKKLHGVQMGALVEPNLTAFLAMRTGLFMEMYFASPPDDWDMSSYLYSEIDLYIPLHGAIRVPISDESFVSVYGGLGFDFLCMASLDDSSTADDDDYSSVYSYFGSDGLPDAYNIAAEIGAELKLGKLMLGFTYSKGLNHPTIFESDDDMELESFVRKMTYTISYNF